MTTDVAFGAADWLTGTTIAVGAGSAPIAPRTNCGLDERPHVHLQWTRV